MRAHVSCWTQNVERVFSFEKNNDVEVDPVTFLKDEKPPNKTSSLLERIQYMLVSIIINRFRSSFICQGTSTRRQRSDLFGLQVKPLKGRGNPVKCLAQGHNKRICPPISTLTLLMLNVKQGSCEY